MPRSSLQASCKRCGTGVALMVASSNGGYCDGCAPAFEGFGTAITQQRQAAEEASGEELARRMREPGRNISQASGEIERNAPLFFGAGDNPSLF